MLEAATMLASFFEKTNNDSTLKYLKITIALKDSLFNQEKTKQVQSLTINEQLRQQEMESAKKTADEERHQNIQYALIGIGIISFIILFLLLSRSLITNTKVIEFFGVLALLIVFEFLNLFLHPYLERFTNHSTLLMLLALVCIASLLIPAHHTLEKWATKKLVEKNKAIRLAAAKKTIQKLDTKLRQLVRKEARTPKLAACPAVSGATSSAVSGKYA